MDSTVHGHLRTLFPSSGTVVDNSARQLAQTKLFEFQKSREAWSFSFGLLSTLTSSSNAGTGGALTAFDGVDWTGVMFFAAQTLQVKITRDWGQFTTAEDQLHVRTQLHSHIYRLRSSGSSFNVAAFQSSWMVIIRKLCCAMAAYCLKTVSSSWRQALDDIVSWSRQMPAIDTDISSGSLSDERSSEYLKSFNTLCSLELLVVLGEEVSRAQLSSDERMGVMSALGESMGPLMQFLDLHLSSPNVNVRSLAVKGLQSWILVDCAPLTSWSPSIEKVVDLLLFCDDGDEQLFEVAVEVIYEVVSHAHSVHYERSLCEGLLPRLTSSRMVGKFKSALENESTSTIQGICKLMIAFGEHFTSYIIEHVESEPVQILLQIIIQCSDFPGYFAEDEDVSDLTLNFWFILQDTLQDALIDLAVQQPGPSGTNDGRIEMSEESLTETGGFHHQTAVVPPAPQNLQTQIFIDIYKRLIPVLIRKASMPEMKVFMTEWNSDTRNRFKTYRRDIADTLIYCHYFLHDKCLETLLAILKSSLRDQAFLEASLFGIRAIAENISASETVYLVQIMIIVLDIVPNVNDKRLLQTIILTIGSYSNWLSNQHQEFINQSLAVIMSHLSLRPIEHGIDITSAAFKTFRNICDYCRKALVPLIADLVQMLRSPEAANLKPNHRSMFLEGLSLVIQAMPVSEQVGPVEVILSSTVNTIDECLKRINAANFEVSKAVILDGMQSINSLFSGIQLNEDDPETGTYSPISHEQKLTFFQNLSQYLRVVWPVVLPVSDRFENFDPMVQQLTSFIENTLAVFKTGGEVHDKQAIHNVYINPELSLSYCRSVCDLVIARVQRSQGNKLVRVAWLDALSSVINIFGIFADLGESLGTLSKFQTKYPHLNRAHYELCLSLAQVLTQATQGILYNCTQQILPAENVATLSLETTLFVDDSALLSLTQHLEQTPDFVEALISLTEMCIRRHPVIVLCESMKIFIETLGLLMLASVNIKEKQAFRSNAQLFSSIMALASTSQLHSSGSAKSLMLWVSPMFIHLLLEGICHEMPRSLLHAAGELFYKFIIAFPNEARIYTRQALGLPTPHTQTPSHPLQAYWGRQINADTSQRELFAKTVLSTRQLKRFREIIKDFATKTRGTFPIEV